MISKGEDIDNLFSKKFEKFEVKPSDSEWIELSPKLNRLNFLKFSFASFNIYYLITFAFLVTATTFSIVRNIQYAQEVQDLKRKLEEVQSKEQVIKSVGTNQYLIEHEANNRSNFDKVQVSQNSDNLSVQNKKAKTDGADSKQNHGIIKKRDQESFTTDVSKNSVIPSQKVEANVGQEKKDTAATTESTRIGGNPSQTIVKKVKKVLVVKPKSVVLKRDTVIIKKDLK